MKIATHIQAFINPRRSSPGSVVARRATPSLAVTHATKPAFKFATAAATSNPFASLFQSFSQTPRATATQSVASPPWLMQTAAPPAPLTVAPPAAPPAQKPGIQALVSAIINGSFHATNVTDPAKLQETTPFGTDTMPSFYYSSDETASQMAQLLGGKVVQRPAFGQNQGWSEPNANFIELPNGQTFNAADLAYYARCGGAGTAQLTSNLTQTINAGAAWTNYYKHGGQMPMFATGYVGPAITGMDYPAGTVAADGTVINPAMQGNRT